MTLKCGDSPVDEIEGDPLIRCEIRVLGGAGHQPRMLVPDQPVEDRNGAAGAPRHRLAALVLGENDASLEVRIDALLPAESYAPVAAVPAVGLNRVEWVEGF